MRDLIIIGGGPGGLGAARGALEAGLKKITVIERDFRAGGILNQCIHDGFGLVRYKDTLTGPEYAERCLKETEAQQIEILTDTMATAFSSEDGRKTVVLQSRKGIEKMEASSIVLATGCRERTRGALAIPGTRPAGILTAGTVQRLMNLHNIMPGTRAVVLGSGDIGLIMARRLTLEGAKVMAVLELCPDSGGLSRNIRQCLQDFGIPVRTRETVSAIKGRNRVEGVTACKVDDNGKPLPGTEYEIDCDLLVLSVGLIPENELAKDAGVSLEERTNNVIADAYLQTSLPGVFTCGNSRKVHDLADYVSEEGIAAGKNAAHYVLGEPLEKYDEGQHDEVQKGIPDAGEMFCIHCPKGCKLRAEKDEQGELRVTGNRCARGIAFARQERERPMRVVTTTVRDKEGRLYPVKSVKPLPLDRLRAFVTACDEIIIEPDRTKDQEVLSVKGYDIGVRITK